MATGKLKEVSKEKSFAVERMESQDVSPVCGASIASKSKSKADSLTRVELVVLNSFCTFVSWFRNSEKSR